ncbi:MAG: tryptophan synthase subunit beta [Bacteroidales bacterium]
MKTINQASTQENQDNKTEQKGYYGEFGGMFVPPVLESHLIELGENFKKLIVNPEFIKEYRYLLKNFVGRPSPLYLARNLSHESGNRIYLKREDLNHTGAHKINNTIGQILIAKHTNAKEVIAETGAGQHGVATATACAVMGIPCKVFMGAEDVRRQAMNVRRIKLLGAEVIEVHRATCTLKDAVDEALDYYIQHPDSFYLLGSQVGPYPYPQIVGYFQKVIGEEARKQILEAEGRLPDHIFACIGGGSNAIGLFSAFLNDNDVQIHAAEGGGITLLNGQNAATLSLGNPMVFQGTYSYCLNKDGEVTPTHSIAAGLDYPGVSPQHSYLKDSGRANYYPVSDEQAISAFKLLSKKEGIIPAIESAHAVYLALDYLKNKNDQVVIINLSGRGEKDVFRDDFL